MVKVDIGKYIEENGEELYKDYFENEDKELNDALKIHEKINEVK